MGSYTTLDGELQHTGWVKINARDAARRFRYILGQNNIYQQYQKKNPYITGSFYFSLKPPFKGVKKTPQIHILRILKS